MRRQRWFSQRTLFAAIAVVVLGFLLSSVYSQTMVARIHGAATDITRDKAPSVECLAAARGDMHQLEMMVWDFVNGEGGRGELEAIQISERQLQQDLANYAALPTDEEERSFVVALEHQMGDLREETRMAVARAQAGDEKGAGEIVRDRIRPTVDRARDLIVQDIALNARQASRDAVSIDALRARSALVTYALDALMSAIAIATALVAGRLLRQYNEMIEDAAERDRKRATELELFSARVAHDVLSPLGPAAMSLDLLARRFKDDDRAQELASRGQAALRRVRTFVDDLLGFARAGAGAIADGHADVARTCQEIIEELGAEAAAAQAALRIEPMARMSVRCPEMLLGNVLRNLVRNAIRHMGDSPRREVVVRALPRGSAVLIEVEDTGPGIPEGLEGRIFEPYVRGPNASSPGLGLGLATVKRIVEAHQGEVGARRRPEGGSLFWATLPREHVVEAHQQPH